MSKGGESFSEIVHAVAAEDVRLVTRGGGDTWRGMTRGGGDTWRGDTWQTSGAGT